MAQKYDNCEICGTRTLVADYGLHNEFICIECSLKDEVLADHVCQEMIRRHGKEQISKWVKDAYKHETIH